jgi:hypothetical protein
MKNMENMKNVKNVKKQDLKKPIIALAIVESIVIASAFIYVVYFK